VSTTPARRAGAVRTARTPRGARQTVDPATSTATRVGETPLAHLAHVLPRNLVEPVTVGRCGTRSVSLQW